MLVDPGHGRVSAADPVHGLAEVRPVGSKPSGDYEAARRHPGSPGFKTVQKIVLAIGGHNMRASCVSLPCTHLLMGGRRFPATVSIQQ